MTQAPSANTVPIGLATVLAGAVPFREQNVNATFQGQVLTSNGVVRDAIIKDLDAVQLANELLGTLVLRAAGLPTPDAYLGLVRNDDLPVAAGPVLQDGNRLVFVSADVKVPNLTVSLRQTEGNAGQRQIIDKVLAWAGLGALYAVDSWVANTDRHPGNLLFGGSDEIWLIDHGHCLSGPNWEPPDLAPENEYPNRLREWATPNMSFSRKGECARDAAKQVDQLALVDLADLRKNGYVDALRTPQHGDAVEQFLKARLSGIASHVNRALGMLV